MHVSVCRLPHKQASFGLASQTLPYKLCTLLQLSEQDQAALMASLDPGYAAQLLGVKGGAPQHPTPRSSLDVGAFGRSEYSTPRTSFEVPQVPPARLACHGHSCMSGHVGLHWVGHVLLLVREHQTGIR